MMKISWLDGITNEVVFGRVMDKGTIWTTIQKEQTKWSDKSVETWRSHSHNIGRNNRMEKWKWKTKAKLPSTNNKRYANF